MEKIVLILILIYFGRFLFYSDILFIFTQLQHKGCAIAKKNNLL